MDKLRESSTTRVHSLRLFAEGLVRGRKDVRHALHRECKKAVPPMRGEGGAVKCNRRRFDQRGKVLLLR